MHAIDSDLTGIVSGVLVVLASATIVGQSLAHRAGAELRATTLTNLNARIRSWWILCAIMVAALLLGPLGSVVLSALVSWMALREFTTLAPTRRADHRILVLVFYAFIPLQYALVATGRYEPFSLLIPVLGMLCIPLGSALAGDTNRFMERAAGILWGVMVCVYAVSHAPALLMLDIPGYAGQNIKLLVFLLIVVESSDVLQYICGKLWGRRAIAPALSPGKTLEGLVGGVTCASLLGAGLWWMTPFHPWEAGALSLVITLAGFAGGLIMSAIKRDRGIKDFGTVIAGHGGVLDRIDSLCFAAPVFFHLTRYFFAR
jgi:phosphatidate cytidylyltransferase